MNILVNGTPLLSPLTGIGQYIRHLFTAMEKIHEARFRVYYGLKCETGLCLPDEDVAKSAQTAYALLGRYVPRPRSVKRAVEQAMFRYHMRGDSRSILYHDSTCLRMPHKGPTVLTVCDLSCFDQPETHPQERVRLVQRDLPKAVARADHIIVISAATREALKRWFDVDDTRISTTYLAADARFRPRAAHELAPYLATVGLKPGAYVLCVGTLEPRKNLAALITAYALLPDALRAGFPLAVAGMQGWSSEGLLQSAKALISRGEVRLLGYVDDASIPLLYAGAAAFCYPSRYEGFGLPALEAMACGVPVITSNRTSLPEVVGDAGLMVDPDDVEGLSLRLRHLLEDRAYANTLGATGVARAATFSWDRCAQETFSVYQQVMRMRGLA